LFFGLYGWRLLAHRGAEFLLYQTKDGRTRVELSLDGDAAWLSLGQMAEDMKTRTVL
jgi:hypothetical protein